MAKPSLITAQAVREQTRAHARTMRREMTRAEQKLWTQLRANRLEGFHIRRQQVVGDYIVDFYCHQAKLILEVDGSSHLTQVEADQLRQEMLEAMGLKALRLTNIEVMYHMDRVLAAILAECRGET